VCFTVLICIFIRRFDRLPQHLYKGGRLIQHSWRTLQQEQIYRERIDGWNMSVLIVRWDELYAPSCLYRYSKSLVRTSVRTAAPWVNICGNQTMWIDKWWESIISEVVVKEVKPMLPSRHFLIETIPHVVHIQVYKYILHIYIDTYMYNHGYATEPNWDLDLTAPNSTRDLAPYDPNPSIGT